MQVIRADSMGLCFGVRDALEYIRNVPSPADVTVYGELVHNDKINRELVQRGFRRLDEGARDGASVRTPDVLITAHGISDTERARLRAAGLTVHDTTCPLVRRAHAVAQHLASRGYFVVVIGRRDHVEARGLTGDLEKWVIVESPDDVGDWPAPRIGVICQTTTPEQLAAAVVLRIRQRNPGKEVRFENTICRPTRDRQRALLDLLTRVDALVAVGGRNSRNTRELTETAVARGVRAFHVESAAELAAEWFAGCAVVGLTAGTSTLDETIDEVHQALAAIPGTRLSPGSQLSEQLAAG